MRLLREDKVRLLCSVAAAVTLHLGILATVEFALPETAPPESSAIRVRLEMRTVEHVDPLSVEAPSSESESTLTEEPPPTEHPPLLETSLPAESPTPIAALPTVERPLPAEEPSPTEPPPPPETPPNEPPPAEQTRIEQSVPTQNMPAGDASSAYERQPAARGPDHFGDPAAPSAPGFQPELQPERYVEPRYPEAARRGSIEGTVVVHFRVNRRGRVQDPEVRRSSGSDLLDREALRAVRMWRFARENVGKESVHRIVFRLE